MKTNKKSRTIQPELVTNICIDICFISLTEHRTKNIIIKSDEDKNDFDEINILEGSFVDYYRLSNSVDFDMTFENIY